MTFAGAQLAQVIAERALNSLPGGILIAALASIVLRIVGKQSSGPRFAVWFSALIAVAALPFIPAFSRAGAAANVTHAEITVPESWAPIVSGLWMAFAAFAAANLFAGLWRVRRLRGSATPLEISGLNSVLRETLAQCKAIRPLTLCSSPAVSVPAAIGFLKPMILIPDWAVRDLPTEELRVILLHEFAHLRRWDDWTNLAQKLIRTIFFFHPAVWWIEKKLSIEREMACDDAVIEETSNPRAYAECLVSLAEKSLAQRSLAQRGRVERREVQRNLAMVQGAISRARETSIRLARILDPSRRKVARGLKPAVGLASAVAAASLIFVPAIPRVIAFKNPDRPVSFMAANDRIRNGSAFPGAQAVVPAKFKTGALALTGTLAQRVQPVNRPALRKAIPTLAVYRPQPSTNGNGKLVPVSPAKQASYQHRFHVVKASARSLGSAQQFLVVMQTTEFDDAGSVFLSVQVWRLTLVTPRENSVRPAVSAKSI